MQDWYEHFQNQLFPNDLEWLEGTGVFLDNLVSNSIENLFSCPLPLDRTSVHSSADQYGPMLNSFISCRIATAKLSCLTTGWLLLCALFRCVLSQSTHTSSHKCHTDKNRYYLTECTGTGTGNTDWEQEKQQIVRGYADTPPRTHRPWWTWGRLLLQPSCWTLGCCRVRSHSVDHTSILPWHTSSRPGQSDTWFPHALLLHLAEVLAMSVQFCILPTCRE